jgi:hypothetical protein
MRRLVLASFGLALLTVPVLGQDKAKVTLDLTGRILLNGFYTSDSTNNSDLPQFVQPRSPSGRAADGLGATVRQTRITLHGLAPDVAGGQLNFELDVDFFGGQQPSSGGRTFPLLRIRRAFGRMSWNGVGLLVGQEAPLITELSPSSLAASGLAPLAAAGNLWLWLPQIRLTGDVLRGGPTRLSLEGAVLAPTGDTPQGAFLTQPDQAERSGRPYLQGRLRLRWGEGESVGEASVGGHLGWLATSTGGRVTSRAGTVGLAIPVGRFFEVRGEGFTGRALAGLGGGGIGQNLGPGDTPIRTTGGWVQALVKPATGWQVGGSVGLDDPRDVDLDPLTQRFRNRVWAAEVEWHPSPLVLGLEFRRLTTRYGGGTGEVDASHVNLAVGVDF